MTNYVVAIPSYNRVNEIIHKTLKTLLQGKVNNDDIYIFVANKEQEKLYCDEVPKNMYGKIIVGKKGITNQRNFISDYFKEGQYIVSIDDDVEAIVKFKSETETTKITNIHKFFEDSYSLLKKDNLYLWGIYPVNNPFFMKKGTTTGLKFIIGVLHGYINRHLKQLKPSIHSESKEDYETSILYYKLDGGVLRYNNITTKTKFNAPGGLGTDRFEKNKNAAEYLKNKYPDIITIFHRKNGMTEVRLSKLPRIN
jgi:hypothetical protein